ncbi:MAG: hypothetical protein DVB23_000181 [Verrucomicrobia bacterium]|nr:MAG: hypothetical protein DVB23_000181 [Verrucomicrobiota bacterium]
MIPPNEPTGVSVIIPVYNESGNLEILCHRTLLNSKPKCNELLDSIQSGLQRKALT